MGVLDSDDLDDDGLKKEESGSSPDAETNSGEVIAPANDGVEISRLEVAGVIIDKYGNTWQVPGDNVEDFDDLYAGDVYKIPKEISDVFHVQLIRLNQLDEYLLRHFVPVRQEEMGIPKELIRNTGHPLDGYHVVNDAILVKIPHAIRERLELRKESEAKRRLMELEPTEEMLAGVKNSDGTSSTREHRMGVNIVEPSTRRGIFADTKGDVK